MIGAVKRYRFTVDQYHRMGKAGIFHPDCRVELVNGEIFEMSPIDPGAPAS
jgi:Uma2 family endonuclease